MPEITANSSTLWIACVILTAILSYFLKDAHTTFKRDVDGKASKEEVEKLRADSQRQAEEWRADLRDDRTRAQEELRRLEQQYEQKFGAAVEDLRRQITTLETHLKDRMDMIVELLEKR